MATILTPRGLRRGFEVSVLASVLGLTAVLLYRGNYRSFLESFTQIRPQWLLVGMAVASLEWFGGGLRHWVITRPVWPAAPLRGMFLAGGMGAWAGYLTPVHGGAGPMMIYSMRRFGVPIPVGISTILMAFVTTIVFFAVAGPLAVALGAGRTLGEMGNVLGLSFFDLFLGSLTVFGGVGVVLFTFILFPGFSRDVLQRVAGLVGRANRRVAARLEELRAGIDQAHQAFSSYNTPMGWLALAGGTVLTGAAYAPRLLAGYVALRALGIHPNFVDVLLLQTLITFLLYFAPTPGASGIGEILAAAVMSVYVPKPLVALYAVIWRLTVSYFTVAFGSIVFYRWVRAGLRNLEDAPVALPG